MERINQYGFYKSGKVFGKFDDLTGDISGGDIMFTIWQAQREIESLLSGSLFPLGVSRVAAESLKKSLDSVNDEYFIELDEEGSKNLKLPQEGDPPIPAWRIASIRRSIETFETVFSAEMAEATTYFVPRRGIYYTPALIDSADKSFPTLIAEYVPEKAKNDWRAAGKCLAFNLLSATGFHVARAVEATLEIYYQLYTGENKTLNGWNDYYKALKDEKLDPKPNQKTLAELLQMKDDYRNPVMHPRVTLTESDARMLFNNGESLIIAMAEEIKALKNTASTQQALALISET